MIFKKGFQGLFQPLLLEKFVHLQLQKPVTDSKILFPHPLLSPEKETD